MTERRPPSPEWTAALERVKAAEARLSAAALELGHAKFALEALRKPKDPDGSRPAPRRASR
jgi:hypothetical protein